MRLYSLKFRDTAQEARYLNARDRWLRERAHRVIVLVALIFAGFAPLDYAFAPQYDAELLAIRILLVCVLAVMWILFRFVLDRRPVATLLVGVAVSAYMAIFAIRIVVGVHSEYEFSQAMMLVQTGVWLIGAFTFVVALAINVIGYIAFELIELQIIHVAWIKILHDSVYIIAASGLAGFAAYTIEKFIRLEFLAREALRKREHETRMQSLRDDLTGLWNRAAMDERVNHAVQQSEKLDVSGAILMIDLDRFKPVNDQYGHSAGDEVLISISRRVQSVVRPGDSVGRMGGDEFMVLVEDLNDPGYPDDLVARLRKVVESPTRVRIYGESVTAEVQVGASIGIARFPQEARETSRLIDLADRRMYEDKGHRKGDSPPQR